MISIIVPIYKVEEYLEKCIDSILEQEYTDLEIILINDGSPDKCGEICDRYAQIDSRIVVIHQNNLGLGEARNVGINKASGDYIGFVDSDDWIDPDMYKILMCNITKNNADIAVCDKRIVVDNKVVAKDVSPHKECQELLLNQEEAFEILFSENDSIDVVVWNKLYKKTVFNGVRYPIDLSYEDAYVISEVLLNCHRVHIINKKLYNYRKRKGSITGSAYNKSKIDGVIAAKRNFDIIKEKYPQFLDNARFYLCKKCFTLLECMFEAGVKDEDVKEYVIGIIKKELHFIIRSDRFTRVRKLLTVLLLLNYRFFSLYVKIKRMYYFLLK